MFRACDSKDNELVEKLQGIYLATWKSVTRNILADTIEASGIAIAEPTHPWGIATLKAAGRSCQPLLCSPEELPDSPGAAAAYGGLPLRNFEEVVAGYEACLTHLLSP